MREEEAPTNAPQLLDHVRRRAGRRGYAPEDRHRHAVAEFLRCRDIGKVRRPRRAQDPPSPLHEIPEVLEIFPLKGLDLGIAYRHEHRKAPVRLCHHLEVLGPDPTAFSPLRSEQSLGHVGELVPLRLLCRDVAPGDEPLLPGTLVHEHAYA